MEISCSNAISKFRLEYKKLFLHKEAAFCILALSLLHDGITAYQAC
jgi:hypothetical protein